MAYTTIDDPSAHFQVDLYTGEGNGTVITNDGNSDLQPDLVWFKRRGGLGYHQLVDSTRGGLKRVWANDDGLEGTQGGTGHIASFDSDGFTCGNQTDLAPSDTCVAWQWKANGGSTSSNTTGDITSTVQANTTAGFSIITYSGSSSANDTVGHGLSAAPQVYWCKARTYTGDVNWINEWSAFTTGSPNLNLDRVPLNYGGDSPLMTAQATTITHTTARAETNHTGTYLIYCWTPIQGYSHFGKYKGSGNADGPFVYTGFRVGWLMVKRVDSAANDWAIFDFKRDPNGNDKILKANENAAEDTSTETDLLSNGFKMRSTSLRHNASGGTYLYMAFAEQPFVTSTGIPCTAR